MNDGKHGGRANASRANATQANAGQANDSQLNEITGAIISSAMRVHSVLGPGLLESAYEVCLAHELISRGLRVRRQVALPVYYDGVKLDIGYRMDLLVDEQVVVEVKTARKITPLFEAQLLSYLRLSRHRVGLIINFHVILLRDGIRRMVYRL